jgi:di/tricarboxylate transporter
MDMEKIGRIVFIIGLVISVIAGFVDLGTYGLLGLIVLGIIVGLLNVTGEEVEKFLLGVTALMVVGIGLGSALAEVPVIANILDAFVSFVAGAGLIVALKEVYKITKSK